MNFIPQRESLTFGRMKILFCNSKRKQKFKSSGTKENVDRNVESINQMQKLIVLIWSEYAAWGKPGE